MRERSNPESDKANPPDPVRKFRRKRSRCKEEQPRGSSKHPGSNGRERIEPEELSAWIVPHNVGVDRHATALRREA